MSKQKKVLFGNGVSTELTRLLNKTKTDQTFVITFNSYENHVQIGHLVHQIESNTRCTIFRTKGIKIDLVELKTALSIFETGAFNAIIAIGGGHAMDLAKLVALVRNTDNIPPDVARHSFPSKSDNLQLILVPTTAGSGSEATDFAVLYVGNSKFSIQNEQMIPDLALLDPKLTYSQTAYQTSCSGLDVICQSIESLWSTNSNELSKKYASRALKLSWFCIVDTVCNPNSDNRAKMHLASHLAGKAIKISKTTGPHACSYALTTLFNIPHGHAVALWMPFFLKFNTDVKEPNVNMENSIDAILIHTNCKSVQELIQKFYALFEKLGIKKKLEQFEIKNLNPQDILELINLERLSNNPRKIDMSEIETAIKQRLI